jgi:hypothetical protein
MFMDEWILNLIPRVDALEKKIKKAEEQKGLSGFGC